MVVKSSYLLISSSSCSNWASWCVWDEETLDLRGWEDLEIRRKWAEPGGFLGIKVRPDSKLQNWEGKYTNGEDISAGAGQCIWDHNNRGDIAFKTTCMSSKMAAAVRQGKIRSWIDWRSSKMLLEMLGLDPTLKNVRHFRFPYIFFCTPRSPIIHSCHESPSTTWSVITLDWLRQCYNAQILVWRWALSNCHRGLPPSLVVYGSPDSLRFRPFLQVQFLQWEPRRRKRKQTSSTRYRMKLASYASGIDPFFLTF